MFEEASQSEKKSEVNFLQFLEIRQLFETAYLDAKSSLLSSSPQSMSNSVSPVPNVLTSSESPTKMSMKNEIFEGISSITPNKFICIHFPLNVSNNTQTSADFSQTLQRPTGANIAACSALTRFHSFKLDEKLMTYSEPLNTTEPITSLVKMKLPACAVDGLSRSNLDLSNTNYDQSSSRVE